MKIKDYKCKCGHDDFFFADKGSQRGIYCSYCGKWLKWADKDEQNLSMKQELVLNKIKADIRKRMVFNSFNEGYVLYDDITEVFDKYKTESE